MPRRIVLTGFMGAGKSTVGVRLARELGWTFVDLDEMIVDAERMSIAEIFQTAGEAAFREREHRTLAAALELPHRVLALGGGALETAANRQLLAGRPDTVLVYLEAPLDVLIDRCEQQYRSQSDAARRPVLEQRADLTARFLRRQPLYESAHWTIPTAGLAPGQIVAAILARWPGSVEKNPIEKTGPGPR